MTTPLPFPTAVSPITQTEGRPLFQHPVLGRHMASYFMDDSIGYIWVDQPHWLDEAYGDAIALTDTGILSRNLTNIPAIAAVMRHNDMAEARGIDIGAGYGIFVRGMRDIGLDFYWSDAYADNLLARGFESDDGTYDVAVAFEVLEHLPNPLEFLRESRAQYGWNTLFFSATCFDETNLPDQSWWYFAFETGQHISLFSRRCLQYIAADLGLQLIHLNGELYAMTDQSDLTWPSRWTRERLKRKYKKATLAGVDYEKMKARVLEDQSQNTGSKSD